MNRIWIPIAALTLMAFAPGKAPLTAHGLGPIRVGMSEAAAIKALGGVRIQGSNAANGDCHLLFPKHGPQNFYVMTVGHRVARISIWDDVKTIKTDKGLGIGSTEAEVRAAYGPSIVTTAQDYDANPARSLTAWEVKEKFGIRYETGPDDRVRAIHAGGPQIDLAEDCG